MYPSIAVIDIGSNSVRLVIYQQLNEYSFHCIGEHKFKVRLGEGAYLKDGYLQDNSIQRAYQALKEFSKIIQNHSISKIIAVATSALRDAPNSALFTNLIQQKLNINIEIIEGQKEAYLGALATKTLLPIENGITIDIGGGSTDIARIKNAKIIETYSLNLGTVRLKELFSKQGVLQEEAVNYINNELNSLPSSFTSNIAIGIGGTARTLSKAIMRFQGNRMPTVQNFSYSIQNYEAFFTKIIGSDDNLLHELKISKNRIDTIREGTLIWHTVLKKLKSKEVVSSAVGLREGTYLEAVNLTSDTSLIKFTNLED